MGLKIPTMSNLELLFVRPRMQYRWEKLMSLLVRY